MKRSNLRCGLGARFHELQPGASIAFREQVATIETGREICVGVLLYDTPDHKASAQEIRSPALTLKRK
jgi:hypothetical protein